MKSALGRSRRASRGRPLRRDGVAPISRCASTPRGCSARDPKLVLHGGGNTSVKTRAADLLGDATEVLCVKGSGCDMAAIEPAGLPAVRLEPLRKLRARDALTDEDMVRLQRANLLDPGAPNPSVETLLHAFLPHKFVDHTHATAVLSLVDQPDGDAICAEVYGDRVGIVPYIMPGFALAKAAAEVFDARPDGRRADPAQARHLHLRRRRARSLRAHDRAGDARRGAARARPQGRVRHRAVAAGDRAASPRSRRSCAAPAACKDDEDRGRVAAPHPRFPRRRRRCSISSTAPSSRATARPAWSRPTTPSAPRTGR